MLSKEKDSRKNPQWPAVILDLQEGSRVQAHPFQDPKF
jgi:hypothetical protein